MADGEKACSNPRMSVPYFDRLAQFVAETPVAAIPPDVLARGRLILADCVGCIVAGNAAPEMRRLAAVETARGGAAASVLGTASTAAPDAAAYLNGTAGTWHDLDEGNLHTKTHAAIQIVPAALAEAEARGRSGLDLLAALVLAYEASARLWRATQVRLAVHPHGTYGPLAAALALCRLRGDGPEAVATAMSIAATLGVAASRQTLVDGATVRNVYTGHSGRAAFHALDLRDAGFSGERDAAGSVFGKIYGEAFDPAASVADLGDTWWIRRSYFKRFAAGRYAHAALDLTEELAARLGPGLRPDAIDRIDVATFFMAATMGGQDVGTPFGLRFSIPALMARRILHGATSPTDDGERAFADPAVHVLARRIFVTEDAAATAAYPVCQPARITVRFADGSVEEAACERILGESDHPLSERTLRDKFVTLAATGWGPDAAARAWGDLARIDAIADIRELTAGWRAAAEAGKTEAT